MNNKKLITLFSFFLLLIAIIVFVPNNISNAKSKNITAYCVANELYLRSGAGTDQPIVTLDGNSVLMKKGQILEIIKNEGEWYKICLIYEGTYLEGYSFATYIKEELPSGVAVISKLPTNKDKKKTNSDESKSEDKKQDSSSDEKADSKEDDKKSDSTSKKDNEQSTSKSSSKNSNKFSIKNAKFEYGATISANALNLRKKATTNSEKLATLTKGTVVTVFNSKIVNKQRWYQVAVKINGKTKKGYMLSDYVQLDMDKNIQVQTRIKNVSVYNRTTKTSKKVLDNNKKEIILKKNFDLKLTKELVGKDGNKWFKVKFTYKNKTVKGYVQAMDIKFVDLSKESNNKDNKESESDEKSTKADETEAKKDDETQKEPEEPEGVKIIDDEKDDEKETIELSFGNAYLLENAKYLSIKSEASYSSQVVKDSNGKPIILYENHPVEVINAVSNEDINWYLIRFMYNDIEYTGYVNTIYVKLVNDLNLLSDNNTKKNAKAKDFETKLEEEGFPESYKEKLRELHALYPNYEFKAFHTGLNWDDVIENESKVGINLIPSSKSYEWLSFEPKAYNFKKDQFTVFDGSTWVSASKEAIEYYMDPRNFLDYNTIFQFEVLTYQPKYQDIAGIENVLKNSIMSQASYDYLDGDTTKNITYAQTFSMAAEYSGVSPFHLASRVKQEVIIGTTGFSNSVTGIVSGYEGLYNYYNIGAYHSTESGGAIRNGLKFAREGSTNAELNLNCLIPWNNRLRSIVGGAFYIGNNYINRGQDTIYLQKFNVTGNNTYGHQYMANVEAPFSEGKRVFTAYEQPETLPIVFKIPVYLNMPKKACKVPEKKYNPNNYLKSLQLVDKDGNKFTLTPSFDADIDQEYSLIVSNEIDRVKVNASSVSKHATVSGNTDYSLDVGNNRLIVNVTAQDGSTRDYVINVVREEKTGSSTGEDSQSTETSDGNPTYEDGNSDEPAAPVILP